MPENRQLSDLEPAIVELASVIHREDLIGYLSDLRVVAELVDWLHDEIGYLIPKSIIRLIIKLGLEWAMVLAGKLSSNVTDKIKARAIKIVLENRSAYSVIALLSKKLRELKMRSIADERLASVLSGNINLGTAVDEGSSSTENLITWQQLCVLEELSEDIKHEIARLSNPQPPIILSSNLMPIGLARLHYRAEITKLYGRDEAIRSIISSLERSENFCWALLEGPGGIGKSRLAFEICMRVGNLWNAGFLPEKNNYGNWHSWQPESPTLIIIDYASTRLEEVEVLIRAISERSNTLLYPVRVLLLDRTRQAQWWNKLLSKSPYIEQSMDDNCLITLDVLSDEVSWHIYKDVLETAGSYADGSEKESFFENLRVAKSNNRPLSVLLLAESKLIGMPTDDVKITLYSMCEKVLQRERSLLEKSHIDAAEEEVRYVLATMVGGLKIDRTINVRLSDIEYLKNVIEKPELLTPPKNGCSDHVTIKAIEPDIIGEVLVLSYLERTSDEERRGLIRLAWKLDAGKFIALSNRAVSDFPESKAVIYLLDNTNLPKDNSILLAWLYLVSGLTTSVHKFDFKFAIELCAHGLSLSSQLIEKFEPLAVALQESGDDKSYKEDVLKIQRDMIAIKANIYVNAMLVLGHANEDGARTSTMFRIFLDVLKLSQDKNNLEVRRLVPLGASTLIFYMCRTPPEKATFDLLESGYRIFRKLHVWSKHQKYKDRAPFLIEIVAGYDLVAHLLMVGRYSYAFRIAYANFATAVRGGLIDDEMQYAMDTVGAVMFHKSNTLEGAKLISTAKKHTQGTKFHSNWPDEAN